ncbi:hypothetical protein [Gryllotalpicola koreensis]|uniref:Uncharacterized protein n=1 Tax=Gryllotalpicola koreensis TaxID=993086 RepID=A0ABP8A349_9MICO
MSKTITLRDKRSALIAGTQFTDGKATVASIGPNLAAYFEAIGATIADDKPAEKVPPVEKPAATEAPAQEPVQPTGLAPAEQPKE